jgi:hypothetical protein
MKGRLTPSSDLLDQHGSHPAGVRCSFLSGAARSVSGHSDHGWRFWLTDPMSRRILHDLWREYLDELDLEAADDEDLLDQDEV